MNQNPVQGIQDGAIKISVVIPCYYSEKMIAKVVTLTREELLRGGYDYEFVLVNDASTDRTFDEIRKLAEADPKIVGVNCGKNLGQHSAIMAGLNRTSGDYIMLMDDDMQTHPSQCLLLVDKIATGEYDVVFAKWKEHKEALWRRLGSSFADWSMRVMVKRPKWVYSSNFLIMSRHIRDEVIKYQGPYVYVQGLIFRSASRFANVDVEHFDREQGTSGYTMKTLIRLWSTILNFSMMPLRAATILGFVFGAVGFILGIVVVVAKMLDPTMVAGWPSLMAALMFFSGILLFSVGLVGEYLGRVFMTVNHSPQFVVREVVDNRDEMAR